MTKTIRIKYCDICNSEADTQIIQYPVLFTTEQTEGRSVKPYIDLKSIDVCKKCLDQIIKVTANGAQGCNNYSIIK